MEKEVLIETGKWFAAFCVIEILIYKLLTKKSFPKVTKLPKRFKKRDPVKDAIYNPKEFRRPRD